MSMLGVSINWHCQVHTEWLFRLAEKIAGLLAIENGKFDTKWDDIVIIDPGIIAEYKSFSCRVN